jgi:hypothetical protein
LLLRLRGDGDLRVLTGDFHLSPLFGPLDLGAPLELDLASLVTMPALATSQSSPDFEKRAIEDDSQFSQHLRACLQFVFAANGGAAVAMLSCLTAISTASQTNKAIDVPTLLFRFACSAGFYLGGVFCALLALFAFTLSKQNWGHFWEDNGFTRDVDFSHLLPEREKIISLGFLPAICCSSGFCPGIRHGDTGVLSVMDGARAARQGAPSSVARVA